MLVLTMFFRMEYTWDIFLHRCRRLHLRCRSACHFTTRRCGRLAPSLGGTWMAAIYMLFLIGTDSDPAAVSRRAQTWAGVSAGDPLRSAEVSAAADCARRCCWICFGAESETGTSCWSRP